MEALALGLLILVLGPQLVALAFALLLAPLYYTRPDDTHPPEGPKNSSPF